MTDTRRFPCRPESVTAARRFVRDALHGKSVDVVEAAELMTSELASNCIRHAHTAFELSIRSRAEVRVEVRDTGDGRPRMRSPRPDEPSGRGLLIVDAMSSTWGVSPSSGGKIVWFTLSLPRAAAADARGPTVARHRGMAAGSTSSGMETAAANTQADPRAARARRRAWSRPVLRPTRSLPA